MTKARMKSDAGTCACDKLREVDPIDLKNIDIHMVQVKLNNTKMKKLAAVGRSPVIQYSAMLKNIAVAIFLGRSQIIVAIASAKGW